MQIKTFSSSFHYSPLELSTAIRIVVLQRGSGDDPITCRLIHTQLGEQPYEVLSYERGPPSHDESVASVDGCDVHIRANLHAALMQSRLAEKDRYLWIDCLSINQADFQERNHQVRMMGKIYKGAIRVLVWLGLARDNSDFAIEMLADKHRLARCIDRFQDPQYGALLALCERSYWRRVWILQEIYLSQSYVVHCGSKSISDTDFNESLTLICRSENKHRYRQEIGDPVAYQHRISKEEFPQTFHELRLWIKRCLAQGFSSTELRNFIYAILGIYSDCQSGEVLPDYNKPLLGEYLETVAFCKFSNGTGKGDYERKLTEKPGLTFDDDIQRLINWTPLAWAAVRGERAAVKLLLTSGNVEADSRDISGRSPLVLAAMRGHDGTLKLLLETGKVDIDARDNSGRTPLLLAVANGHDSVVKLLLETGKVDGDARDYFGRTPLLLAAAQGVASIVNLLLKIGNVEPDLGQIDSQRTPLLLAAQNGHEAIVKLLLDTGEVEIDSGENFSDLKTLGRVARTKHLGLFDILCQEKSAGTNSKPRYSGRTPLSLAAENGHAGVVKLLLETGKVNVNSKETHFGKTPLSFAVTNGHETVAKLLLKAGKVNAGSKKVTQDGSAIHTQSGTTIQHLSGRPKKHL